MTTYMVEYYSGAGINVVFVEADSVVPEEMGTLSFYKKKDNTLMMAASFSKGTWVMFTEVLKEDIK